MTDDKLFLLMVVIMTVAVALVFAGLVAVASGSPAPSFDACRAACAPAPILAFEAGKACYCTEAR